MGKKNNKNKGKNNHTQKNDKNNNIKNNNNNFQGKQISKNSKKIFKQKDRNKNPNNKINKNTQNIQLRCNEFCQEEILKLRPDVEYFKMQCLNKISQYIIDMFSSQKVTPPMTLFEKWRWINKYNYDNKIQDNQNKNTNEINQKLKIDGLIPDTQILEQYILESFISQNIPQEKSIQISKQIGKTVSQIIKSIYNRYEQPNNSTLIIKKDNKYNHIKLQIQNENSQIELLSTLNPSHYEKLLNLYKKNNHSQVLKKFNVYLFTILARYKSFQCPGNQAAIPDSVFEILKNQFGVKGECFASPMNCYIQDNYYSAFSDIDTKFQSNGNFFDNKIEEGSYEANPPFIPELMEGMVDHMENILINGDKLQKKISFCIVVPYREDQKYWQKLQQSKFQTGFFVIMKNEHKYKQGIQQEQQGYKQSTFDTGILFLQTKEGKKQWPLTTQKAIQIKQAMK